MIYETKCITWSVHIRLYFGVCNDRGVILVSIPIYSFTFFFHIKPRNIERKIYTRYMLDKAMPQNYMGCIHLIKSNIRHFLSETYGVSCVHFLQLCQQSVLHQECEKPTWRWNDLLIPFPIVLWQGMFDRTSFSPLSRGLWWHNGLISVLFSNSQMHLVVCNGRDQIHLNWNGAIGASYWRYILIHYIIKQCLLLQWSLSLFGYFLPFLWITSYYFFFESIINEKKHIKSDEKQLDDEKVIIT